MKITKRIDNHNYILKLSGSFTSEDCSGFQNALEEGSKSFCSNVFIDMQELQNINSSGQRILLSFLSRLSALDMMLILFGVDNSILKTFKESGMANFIQIADSLEDAKAMVASKY